MVGVNVSNRTNMTIMNLMFIGPCIIVIVEEQKTSMMSLAIYFTSYALNMFRILICPSSEACDYSVVIQQNSRKLLMMDMLMSETC